MPISATVPSIWPPSAPAWSRTSSPTRNGCASSKTMPANTLDSDCCAAIPTKTLVSAPPRRSWPIGTPNRPSVTISVVSSPTRTSAYLMTAACEGPANGSSTDLTLPDRPMVAALANTQNATAVSAAMIWLGTWCPCLLYTSDAADDLLCVDLGG